MYHDGISKSDISVINNFTADIFIVTGAVLAFFGNFRVISEH